MSNAATLRDAAPFHTCPDCEGTGWAEFYVDVDRTQVRECPECKGRGEQEITCPACDGDIESDRAFVPHAVCCACDAAFAAEEAAERAAGPGLASTSLASFETAVAS